MKKNLPHYIFLFTTLIAAINYSISKILMPEFISPSSIIFVRCASAFIFFSFIFFSSTREKLSFVDFGRIVLSAILGIAANQLLFMEGLNKTTPINASLMMTGAPVAVMLIAIITKKEKFTGRKLLGLLCGGIGTLLLLSHSIRLETHQILIGDIFILLNAFCWALFLVVMKPLINKYHPNTIVPLLYLIGFLFVVPFSWSDFQQTQFHLFSIKAMWALAFIIIFSTWIAYYLNIYALKYVNPSVAGIYIYLQPVLATLVSILSGKDVLTIEKLAFSSFIFVGIYLVSKKDVVTE